MKKILVPVDFSVFSDLAVKAAIDIAGKINAEIHVYHSANIPDDWEDLLAELRYKDEINKTRAIWVRDKLNELKKQIVTAGIICETHFTGGKFIDNIIEVLSKIEFDLIIMGSHGVSGKEEWFIGSNTQKVLRKINTKLLVLKKELKDTNFKNIMFATGLHKEDQTSFKQFLEFMKPFNTKSIHIVSINTSSYYTQPAILMNEMLKEFKEIAKEYDITTKFFSDFSVEAGIRHYAEENKIDLIGISNHVKHPVKRIFQGSNVEMIINHSETPVLSIDYKNKTT